VVAVIAAVALVVLGSATWLRSPAAVAPLPADSPGGMPDRLYPSVSEWLPGTDGAGPLGPIAAVLPAIRHTWGLDLSTDRGVEVSLGGERSDGIVGVSASTGAYRFLDLPGLAKSEFGGSWSLSADGKYVAYMYRAPGSHAAVSAVSGTEAADGVALYDTRTGEVRRHEIASEHGVAAHDWFWTGHGTVVVEYGLVSDDGTGSDRADRPLVWDVHVQAPHELRSALRTFGIGGAGPGFVVMDTLEEINSEGLPAYGHVMVDPATGTILRDLGKHAPDGVWDPSGTRTAVSQAGNGDANGITPVVISTLPTSPDGKVTRELVPGGVRVGEIYSWVDEDHLVVLQVEGVTDQTLRVASLDIHTGKARPLVALSAYPDEVQLAGDLLAAPTVPGIEPPRPLDPRKVTAGGVLVAFAALVALIMWRRRVQP
jgi:hypothetical protein